MTLIRQMNQKIWLLLIILMIGMSACGKSPLAACPGLKVGVLYSNDEEAAKVELQAGYEEAIKEVNGKGIVEGCKVEVVFPRSSKTAAADVAKDVQDLVDQGALVIVSAQANDAAKRIAKVSRYLQIPVIVSVDTGDEILEPAENPWFVRINPTNANYPARAYQLALGSEMIAPARIAILFEATEYGESSAVDAGKAALAQNITIGLYHRYSPFLTDFKEISSLLSQIEPAANMVYLISTRPEQAKALLKQVSDVRTTLGAVIPFDFIFGQGSAFTSREFLYDSSGALNTLPSNLVLPVSWWGDFKWSGNAQCAQAALPAPGLGTIKSPVLRNVQGYASMRLAISGIEQLAKKTNWQVSEKKTISDWKEMLRSAEYVPIFRSDLAQVYRATKTCQIGTQLWPVSFNAAGQNQRTPLLVQFKDGKLTTLSPSP